MPAPTLYAADCFQVGGRYENRNGRPKGS